MTAPTVTVVEHAWPTCTVCGTPLRLSRSVAAGGCCCCRGDHAPDVYVDDPAAWQVAS